MESLVEEQRSNRRSWKVEFGVEIGSRTTGGPGFRPMELRKAELEMVATPQS